MLRLKPDEDHFLGHRWCPELQAHPKSQKIPVYRRSHSVGAVSQIARSDRRAGGAVIELALRSGGPVQCRAIASTPDLEGEPRCNAILEWLRCHPDVERFIVIDDEDDELDALPLFQPLRSTGLTDEIVEAAADYLNGKTDKDMRRNKLVRIFQDLSALVIGHKG